MSDDASDTPIEEIRNSQLLRAEYGIPSDKDEEWRVRSRSDDQSADDKSSRRDMERAIDPIELARTEELIARARFFTRVRAATDTGGAVVGTTVRRLVPIAIGCAVATVVGVSALAWLVLKRNEVRRPSTERYAFAQPIQALGVGLSRGLLERLLRSR
jgi:hypothetical protein